MNLREAYEDSLRRDGHERDPAQEIIVARLEDLQQFLLADRPGGLRRLFNNLGGRSLPGYRGLYIWGGVGRGKTFLMDLFFDTLPIPEKKRIHFHRMMRDVHERLKSLGDTEDPLDKLGEDIAAGRLLKLLPEYRAKEVTIYAVYAGRRHLTPKVRAFIDYMKKRLANPPYWDIGI